MANRNDSLQRVIIQLRHIAVVARYWRRSLSRWPMWLDELVDLRALRGQPRL